jgi:hypothetical protein
MKKLFLITALFAFTLTAFGQIQLSAGGGASFMFGTPMSIKVEMSDEWVKQTMNANTLTIKAFVDAKYVEANFGLAMLVGGLKQSTTYSDGLGMPDTSVTNDYTGTWLVIGALGKYPFAVSGIEIFPLAGFEYEINLTMKDEDGSDLKASMSDDYKNFLNQFWLKVGIGADITLAKSLYIRPEVLFGLKFISKLEQDMIDSAEDSGLNASAFDSRIDIGVAVGYKF